MTWLPPAACGGCLRPTPSRLRRQQYRRCAATCQCIKCATPRCCISLHLDASHCGSASAAATAGLARAVSTGLHASTAATLFKTNQLSTRQRHTTTSKFRFIPCRSAAGRRAASCGQHGVPRCCCCVAGRGERLRTPRAHQPVVRGACINFPSSHGGRTRLVLRPFASRRAHARKTGGLDADRRCPAACVPARVGARARHRAAPLAPPPRRGESSVQACMHTSMLRVPSCTCVRTCETDDDDGTCSRRRAGVAGGTGGGARPGAPRRRRPPAATAAAEVRAAAPRAGVPPCAGVSPCAGVPPAAPPALARRAAERMMRSPCLPVLRLEASKRARRVPADRARLRHDRPPPRVRPRVFVRAVFG
jgi:hypothetical protein